ncbi:uncharacterized protein K460DRAFT_402485 [Cucurbitaria berberidis CBS 394.84]|uniref:Glycine zipper 2TM domain-containing protein n=1 Tax=Cucurbitaria berberidis CBS 394.84 TaxID=1168544 RepID=A0A9P4GL03_9PLEO|nr:uncharacterized protein K460DRAFT_402485 [Cucurbitaria berberidis CBS 394.84]KAF1847119.1 hypothetical protein K460DRAFT_402485 [Cucurbitaria berberidis CBS 394.84]
MSGPYDQYNQGYQQQYPPQGQIPYPQQPGHDQGGYQQPGYPPQQQQQQGGYYNGEQQNYNQQYGAPANGGFQHGQQVAPYDQQQQGQYGQQPQYGQQSQYPAAQPQNQFPQQGAYAQDQYPQGQGPNAYGQPPQHGQPGQPGQPPFGSTDPNAQAEGDRGMMGALGGGAAGYFGGNKMGGHGIIGAIAGAVLGSKLEDKAKKPKHSQGGW